MRIYSYEEKSIVWERRQIVWQSKKAVCCELAIDDYTKAVITASRGTHSIVKCSTLANIDKRSQRVP